MTALTVGTFWCVGRFLDRRTFADFGFRRDRGWWLGLAFGALVPSRAASWPRWPPDHERCAGCGRREYPERRG